MPTPYAHIMSIADYIQPGLSQISGYGVLRVRILYDQLATITESSSYILSDRRYMWSRLILILPDDHELDVTDAEMFAWDAHNIENGLKEARIIFRKWTHINKILNPLMWGGK